MEPVSNGNIGSNTKRYRRINIYVEVDFLSVIDALFNSKI